MTTDTNLDVRIFRRAWPFIEQSVRDPDQPAALKAWLEDGMPGLALSFPEAEKILFHAGPDGPPFCRMDSRNAGIWYSDHSWFYWPDEVMDDDLDSMDPIELASAR